MLEQNANAITPAAQTITVAPSAEEQTITINKEALLKAANELKVETPADFSEATDTVKAVKTLLKKAEAERKTLTQPLDAVKKNIMERFKKITDPLEKVEDGLKAKMLAYQKKANEDAEAKRKEAEQRSIEDAKALARQIDEENKKTAEAQQQMQLAGEVVEAPLPPPPAVVAPMPVAPVPAPQRTHYGTNAVASVKQVWRYEVTDITVLASFCPELVEAKGAEIQKAINAGERNIPGVRIFQEDQIAVR